MNTREREVMDARKVFVDMDGVIVDFDGYKTAHGLTGDEVKARVGAYLDMQPIPGAIEAVRSLIGMGYEVWLATKPPTGIPHAYSDKAAWVMQHLPELKRRIVITHDKGMLGGARDFLCDDRPHKANCEKFAGTLLRFVDGYHWPEALRDLRAARDALLAEGSASSEGAEAVYQVRSLSGSWIEVSKAFYEICADDRRTLYTRPQPAQGDCGCYAETSYANGIDETTTHRCAKHAQGEPATVDALAQFIRTIDGNHELGAAALAEKIVERFALSQGEHEQRITVADVARLIECKVADVLRAGRDKCSLMLTANQMVSVEDAVLLARWTLHEQRSCEGSAPGQCLSERRPIADDVERAESAHPRGLPAGSDAFQARVKPWMLECFGKEISNDVRERGDRLLEEVLELLQSHGYDPSRVATLRDYVYGRPAGEPTQEVGGVMVTLAAYCLATNVDMHEAGEVELARIWTKVEAIRSKQASKRGLHTPLPVPPATAEQPSCGQDARDARIKNLREVLEEIAASNGGGEGVGFYFVEIAEKAIASDDAIAAQQRQGGAP